MADWFNTIFSGATPTMLQVFWVFALFASIVFVIQMVMTFFGFDADSDDGSSGDADFDTSGYHLFTIKSLVVFLLGYGWAGVLLWENLHGRIFLINAISVITGLVFVLLMFLLIRQVTKLSVDHSFRIEQSVGKTGSVYLKIPGHRTGTGKIQLSVNGSVHELNAQTEGYELPTGTKARVVSFVDEESVMVEGV